MRGSNKSSKNVIGGAGANDDIENDIVNNFDEIFGDFFVNLHKNHAQANGKVNDQIDFFKWKNSSKKIKKAHEDDGFGDDDVSYITLNKTLRIIAAASYLDRLKVNPATLMGIKNINEFNIEIEKVIADFEKQIVAAYNKTNPAVTTAKEAIEKLYLQAADLMADDKVRISVPQYIILNGKYTIDKFDLIFETKIASGNISITYQGDLKIIETLVTTNFWENTSGNSKKNPNPQTSYNTLNKFEFVSTYDGKTTQTAAPAPKADFINKSSLHATVVLNNIHESLRQGYFKLVYGDKLDFKSDGYQTTDSTDSVLQKIKDKLKKKWYGDNNLSFRNAFSQYFMFVDERSSECNDTTFFNSLDRGYGKYRINLKKQSGGSSGYATKYADIKTYAGLAGGSNSPYGTPTIVDILPEIPSGYRGVIWADRTTNITYDVNNADIKSVVTKNGYRSGDTRNFLRAVGIEALFDLTEKDRFPLWSGLKLQYSDIINVSNNYSDFYGTPTAIDIKSLLRKAAAENKNAKSYTGNYSFRAINNLIWARDKNSGIFYVSDGSRKGDTGVYAYDNDLNNCPLIEDEGECANFIAQCVVTDKFSKECDNFFSTTFNKAAINVADTVVAVSKMNPTVAKGILKRFKVGMVVDKTPGKHRGIYRVQTIDSWLKKVDAYKDHFGNGNETLGAQIISRMKENQNFLTYIDIIAAYVNSQPSYLNPEIKNEWVNDGPNWRSEGDEKIYKVKKYIDPYPVRSGSIGDLTSALNNMRVTMDNAYSSFHNGVNVNSVSFGVNPSPINLAVNPAMIGPFAASMLRGGYDIFSDEFINGGYAVEPVVVSQAEVFRQAFERIRAHAAKNHVTIDEKTVSSFLDKLNKYKSTSDELNEIVGTIVTMMEIKERSGGVVDIMSAIPDDLSDKDTLKSAKTLIEKHGIYLNRQIQISNKLSQRGIQIVTTISNLANAVEKEIAKENGKDAEYLEIV